MFNLRTVFLLVLTLTDISTQFEDFLLFAADNSQDFEDIFIQAFTR